MANPKFDKAADVGKGHPAETVPESIVLAYITTSSRMMPIRSLHAEYVAGRVYIN
jgi:hypothetical protein